MVHQPSQPSEIKAQPKRKRAKDILIDTLVMLLVGLATFAFLRLTIIKPENREINNPSVIKSIDENNSEQE